MKSRVLIIGIIAFILVGLVVIQMNNSSKKITSSLKSSSNQIINSTPTPTPVKIIYNKTTDLKKELETVNPRVEESDFTELANFSNSL